MKNFVHGEDEFLCMISYSNVLAVDQIGVAKIKAGVKE
jgi:hypothetical protein